jgi:aldose 1-epimerase
MTSVSSPGVTLSSGRSFALIDLTGAWIKSLVLEDEEILKESVDGKKTHGGACSLIPFAGRVRNATYRFDGTEYTLPRNNGNNSIHGFIRDTPFHYLKGHGENDATLFAKAENNGYPSQIEVSIAMCIEDSRFKTSYSVKNTGEKRAPLVIGCHPYFLAGRPWRLLHSSRLERLVLTDQYFPDGAVADTDFNSVKDLGELELALLPDFNST